MPAKVRETSSAHCATAPPDLVSATQLASAADWARIYLLSGLDDDVVDELFLSPIANESEVRRLSSDQSRCLFLESAQLVHATVRAFLKALAEPTFSSLLFFSHEATFGCSSKHEAIS